MHTVELYRKVRLACRDGMSERAAARHFGVSRQSVRKMLQFSVPPGYRRTAPVRRPKLDEFTALIEQWLEDDRRHGYRKQRHTAKRIFERLRDEHGFTGGYTIVKDYVREHRRHRREMFVPLTHPPGHAQADFGEAWAVIAGVKQKVHFFAFDLPQSDASYVRAYRAATAEAWVDGHVHAFSFFGAVALSIVYDNDRCLVSRIERDGTRRRTRLFSGFLSSATGRAPGQGQCKGAVVWWAGREVTLRGHRERRYDLRARSMPVPQSLVPRSNRLLRRRSPGPRVTRGSAIASSTPMLRLVQGDDPEGGGRMFAANARLDSMSAQPVAPACRGACDERHASDPARTSAQDPQASDVSSRVREGGAPLGARGIVEFLSRLVELELIDRERRGGDFGSSASTRSPTASATSTRRWSMTWSCSVVVWVDQPQAVDH